ncbi:LuxR C-terminal-related transcriptional regulator [Enterobacter sichuanensis]|uniref:helix-turn-helix domain-containing protein n=1 Tax=Enterobacter sichuanensis TaxID=2071710 RepID=UPI002DB6CCA4|nr:LuxR C-terminal-related transcriptional regulator [Enterobacter sichuanensis]MEB5959753.1 LuxR C-terminal-related transcriptional regulator [Enterobacter sichuanensis]
MAIFKIISHSTGQTYVYGMLAVLNQVLKNQAHWNYLILNQSQVKEEQFHLTLLDFTNHLNNNVTLKEENLILNTFDYRTLILLNNEQPALASQLYNMYSCSLLCIDELNFHVLDLIECCLQKRRFISAEIITMIDKYAKLHKNFRFTNTEMRILSALNSGRKGVEISENLHRSQKTISSHKRRIMKKLGAKDDLSLKLMMREIDSITDNIL